MPTPIAIPNQHHLMHVDISWFDVHTFVVCDMDDIIADDVLDYVPNPASYSLNGWSA